MSNFALKVVASCPNSLLNGVFRAMFAAKNGLLIADVSGNLATNTNSWGGRIFSEEEKLKYREAIDFLTTRGAILDYKPSGQIPNNESELAKVCRELSSPSRVLHCAISDEENLQIPDSLQNLFFKADQAVAENELDHKHVDIVPMTAEGLVEALTPYAFHCNYFKIIDPYIYELNSYNVREWMDFLVALCTEIETNKYLERDEIVIEVIGRSYYFFKPAGAKKKEKRDINVSRLKNIISSDKRLEELKVKKFRIKFIGLDDRNEDPEQDEYADPLKRMHNRVLMTDKYFFHLEHPFQTRPNEINTVHFGKEYSRSEMQRAYCYDSDQFDTKFGFGISEITF